MPLCRTVEVKIFIVPFFLEDAMTRANCVETRLNCHQTLKGGTQLPDVGAGQRQSDHCHIEGK
jgi:hypothetical protein